MKVISTPNETSLVSINSQWFCVRKDWLISCQWSSFMPLNTAENEKCYDMFRNKQKDQWHKKSQIISVLLIKGVKFF